MQVSPSMRSTLVALGTPPGVLGELPQQASEPSLRRAQAESRRTVSAWKSTPAGGASPPYWLASPQQMIPLPGCARHESVASVLMRCLARQPPATHSPEPSAHEVPSASVDAKQPVVGLQPPA